MKTKEYDIRLPHNDAERTQAIHYVCDHMFQTHRSHPPPEKTPPHLFIALEKDEIVGSLAIEFGTPSIPLPFEHFFSFSKDASSVPYERAKTIYYSRWNSSRKSLGPIIWLAVSEYALRQGMLFSSSTAKPVMIEHCFRTLGFQWHPIQEASIQREKIGKEEEGYFLGEISPLPCLGFLEDQVKALRPIVKDICAKEQSKWQLLES